MRRKKETKKTKKTENSFCLVRVSLGSYVHEAAYAP